MQNKTLNEYLEQLKIYVQESNYIDSIDLLNRAISQYPEENKLKLNLGNIYKLLERNDDAVKLFSLLEDSELADLANNNLSLIYLEQGDLNKSIEHAKIALSLNQNYSDAKFNLALAFFEKNKLKLSIQHFEKAISIEDNAEPLLGLASCLRFKNIKLALELAKKALAKDPNYVNYNFRKEQLWGDKLQASTEMLLQNKELKNDVILAKSKINASS